MANFVQKIVGASSGNLLEVDANNQIKVVLSNSANNMGGVRLQSEVDTGSIRGTALLRSPETSSDFRLRIGNDNILDYEAFNYAAQNSSKHYYNSSTLTITYAGGFITTNGGSSVASGVGAWIRTWRHFPLYGTAPIYVDFDMAYVDTMVGVSNAIMDHGLFLPPASAVVAPSDGVYFRHTSAGVQGILNNNGTETSTGVFNFTPTIGQTYNYTISITRDIVEFWIDDVLYGYINTPLAQGTPMLSGSLPVAINHRNTAATVNVWRTKFASYTVTVGELPLNRSYAHAQSSMGLNAIQGASGMTIGQTCSYVNSTAPVSGTLANTTAAYATLGGAWQFSALAGAETDYILFAYLNPAPTALITGRNLVITSVMIDAYNTGAAVATTPTLLQWAVGTGDTGVSLATGDTVNTRASRRIYLGTQYFPVGAAIGQCADKRIETHFDTPLVVESNTYFHVILRMPVGTATASQVIRGIVGVNGYWE